MSRLCDMLDAVLECMFGARSVTLKSVRIDSYRERLLARLDQARRERAIAARNSRDKLLLPSEREREKKKARQLDALLAAGQKKLALIESADMAMDQLADNRDFVAAMRRAGVPKLQSKLEKTIDAAEDTDDLIQDLMGMIGGDTTVDESELELEPDDREEDALPLLGLAPGVPQEVPGQRRKSVFYNIPIQRSS